MAGRAASPGSAWTDLRALVRRGIVTAAPLWPYHLIMYAVGAIHLAEVNLLDARATAWVEAGLGSPVSVFAPLEAPVFHGLETLWAVDTVAAVSAYYLVGFIALLWWTPVLVAASGDRARLKRVLLTYPLLYLIALPGYLFLPQANPYVALDLADPFSPLHAGLEEAYYLFTTPNNTFPSLHVGFTVALTIHLARSRSQLLGGAAVVHGSLLVLSVVYLRVHWIGDVVGGMLAAWLALTLTDQAASREGPLGAVVRWLDRQGHRGSLRILDRPGPRG